MRSFKEILHRKFKDGKEYERSLDPRIEAISRRIWPWKENKLLVFTITLIILDYCSTYAFLNLSGNSNLYEGNPIARWALERGGFPRLLAFDLTAAFILIVIAVSIRHFYTRIGYKGYGRLSFVLMLIPYIVITLAAIFNNIALTFMH